MSCTFQSTLPRREWRVVWTWNFCYVNFNPHSREGSDLLINDRIPYTDISIHTPAKGVTYRVPCQPLYNLISIHTPAKGVTQSVSSRTMLKPFQSTLPRREWLRLLLHSVRSTHFNPHSREGSDQHIFWISTDSRSFQSTLPRREWHILLFTISFTNEEFQSTLPRREWRIIHRQIVQMLHFNPHSREGSDAMSHGRRWEHEHFNPHSREGSDSAGCDIYVTLHIFQSTLPRREWRYLFRYEPHQRDFNPHSREGSDRSSSMFSLFLRISIHTPAKGVTAAQPPWARCILISIHTPAKGVTTWRKSPCYLPSISIHTPAKGVTLCWYCLYRA